MASSAPPSTPKAATAASTIVPVPDQSQTPGKWRHPHLDEVVRRQNAGTFGDRNINKLVWNGAALFATCVFGDIIKSYCLWLQHITQFSTYPDLSLLILRVIFVLNILVALYPLFGPKDDLADIPLTPTQRSLLGLDPTATPPLTPGTSYVTPPKYRLSTSRGASPASRSGSPLSASAGASGRRVSSGPAFSPSPSPLFQKLVNSSGKESGRRPSFGSSSPLGRSTSYSPYRDSTMTFKDSTASFKDSTASFKESTMSTVSSMSLSTMSSLGPASPSPVGGKRVNLGLSNKWLYERSRRLSASNSSY
ncbi:NPCC-domain-containing protein [Aspergillus japonicus CBS 114.51]|uniref:NPCC-domain-containing protein n=2 Tax=Aspergillus TaxID=5052 RepID=A0A2V5IFW2_ASPV1|nr:NPCC-domain-containing protein [Aspergillus japonicus CBS 114.51]PYI18546.1 NPCC-domain-containing protein [Aspergillus violaceofuscus CBS 115571]RAH77635.1 NPCC-domain-containing protein [Aspergillus japonicus CBS 114.51]